MRKGFWILLLALCIPFASMAEEIVIGRQSLAADTAHVVLESPRLSASRLISALSELDAMESLALMNCVYEPKDLIKIREAFPDVDFRAVFKWKNHQYDTDATETAIRASTVHINDLRAFLDVMSNLKEADMNLVRISLDNMKGILADYPQIEFAWKLPINNKRIPTNVTAYSTKNEGGATGHKTDYFEEHLPYLPDLLALDLGHNSIDDLNFLSLYPELRVLILADNELTGEDLETLARCCPKLEYLEIFMNRIEDISALAKLKNLRHLNISRNRIADASPILEMPQLERCWIAVNQFPEEQRQMLREAMPQTWFEFDAINCTAAGWRENSKEYAVIFQIFKHYAYMPFDTKE